VWAQIHPQQVRPNTWNILTEMGDK
jgi:hypothetical protein